MRPTIGTDTLANKAKELELFLVKKGITVILLNRLKSIHGPEDDIIEIDLDLSANLRLLGDDDNPGKYILIGIQKLIDRDQLPADIWDKLAGLTDLEITPKHN